MRSRKNKPIAWLPVDSRLFGSFLSFGHVRGVARLFLIIEITSATLVVVGTLFLVAMSMVSY